MIISMSPISIKPRSKEDIFRLGDFDKHVTPANPNNAQRSDDSNSTQLPPFGGYPSLSGDSSKKQFYYGKKNEPSENQGKHSNTVLHTKLLQPPINDQILPTTRVTLDNRPISRGRFRSSRGLPYGIPAVSNRRARTAIGSSRSKLKDSQMFSAGSAGGHALLHLVAVDLDSAGCVKARKKEYSGFDPLQKCVCVRVRSVIFNVHVCVLYLMYAKVCDCHNSFSSTLVRVRS